MYMYKNKPQRRWLKAREFAGVYVDSRVRVVTISGHRSRWSGGEKKEGRRRNNNNNKKKKKKKEEEN